MTKTPKHGEPHAERHEHHIYQEKSRFEWALETGIFLLLIGTLVATGIAAYWTSWQWSAAHDQLGVMQDTEQRQLRAYVGVVPGDVEDFGDSTKQRFHLVRKNYGVTPAYDVGFSSVTSRIIKVGTVIGDIPGSGGICATPNARPGLAGQITMFPGVELQFLITGTQPFTNEEIQSVRLGTYQMVYLGDVCYRDAFGAPHYTNYCWMFNGNSMTAKDADGCLTHNDSN